MCFAFRMSLTNEEIETQLLQLADALEKMSNLTVTALQERDAQVAALTARIEALEASQP